MILVLCPNLAVDATLAVSRLHLGAVHRAGSAARGAGGKGVNVARALRALGEPCLVLGFTGGRRGEEIREGLEAEELESDLVPVERESRTCTIVLEESGRATVVNEEGPRVEEAETASLASRFETRLERARAVAFMGSLPPGAPDDLYRRLGILARERGVYLLVDTSGPPLAEALGSRPSVVKPNLTEAEELLDRDLGTEASRYQALAELRSRGAEVAMITLGEEGLLVDGEGAAGRFTAPSPSDLRLGNPTGAGDTLAAGLLAGAVRGYGLRDAVALGVAAAVASLAEGYGRIRAKDLRPEAVAFEPHSGDRAHG